MAKRFNKSPAKSPPNGDDDDLQAYVNQAKSECAVRIETPDGEFYVV